MSEPSTESASEPKRPDYVRLREKGIVTLPLPLRTALGLKTGDQLILTVEEGRIVLTPGAVVPRDQAWFHTPEWQAKEAEADADKAAGRVTRHDSDEGFLASFDEPPKEA